MLGYILIGIIVIMVISMFFKSKISTNADYTGYNFHKFQPTTQNEIKRTKQEKRAAYYAEKKMVFNMYMASIVAFFAFFLTKNDDQ